MLHRANLDAEANPSDVEPKRLKIWCELLEKACIDLIGKDRKMTKDLALSIKGDAMTEDDYVETFEFIDLVNKKLSTLISQEKTLS